MEEMKRTDHDRKPTRLGWLLRALPILVAVSACDSATGPDRSQEDPVQLQGSAVDPSRVQSTAQAVAFEKAWAESPDVELSQVGFVRRPKGLPGNAGATSTTFYPRRMDGVFATVYNTAGSTVGGAITTMAVRRGRLRAVQDIKAAEIDFAEARFIESEKGSALMASGTAKMGGSLEIQSEAIFLYTDLVRTVNVFDLPSGWVMGFDAAPDDPDRIVAATGPTGSLSVLDPHDPSGGVRTIAEGEPAFLGLSTHDGVIYVTDATGSVRGFDADGVEVSSWLLPEPFNSQERAEISVCSEAMVVGGHTNGILLLDGDTRVISPDFGLGASFLDDCSAFAATTEGAVVVGLEGEGGYDTYTLTTVRGVPLPYANSVEIIRLDDDSPVTGGRWGDDGMLLVVVSSAQGTHFIDVRREED